MNTKLMPINAPQKPVLLSDQVTAIQHRLKLSDEQLAEALNLSPSNGPRRIRKWKSGAEIPSGPAATLLLLLDKIDRALGRWDDGMPEGAIDILRNALPDFLQ